MVRYLFFTLFLLIASLVNGQDDSEKVTGFYFGPKAGLTLGNQNWNGFEKRPMFNYHAAVFMESLDPNFKGSIYGQIGYHTRGSGLNLVNITQGLNFRESLVWNNISVAVGGKKRILTSSLSTPYYFVGIRAEYSISNNLEEIQNRFSAGAGSPFYPFPTYSKKIVYGLSFGGGYEFYGSEFVQPGVEINISPDLAFQYQQPEIGSVINPYDGRPTVINERTIRNVTFEISFYVKFKREVILLDR